VGECSAAPGGTGRRHAAVNTPIAPEVLDTLSRDFAASGFDLRRLTRALVLTKRISFPANPKTTIRRER